MAQQLQNTNFRGGPSSTIRGGQGKGTPSSQTGTAPDAYGAVVLKARQVLATSQSGLLPKASTNTAGNTNVMRLDKTIGDLADLVETTFDPVWKETYRIALLRTLAASEKAKGNATDTVASASAISDAGHGPETFNSPHVGIVEGLDVSAWSARQAGYQQRFNAPPPVLPPPSLPLDPVAAGSQYNQKDVPGLGTTAIPTVNNRTGWFFSPRGVKPIGTSHK